MKFKVFQTVLLIGCLITLQNEKIFYRTLGNFAVFYEAAVIFSSIVYAKIFAMKKCVRRVFRKFVEFFLRFFFALKATEGRQLMVFIVFFCNTWKKSNFEKCYAISMAKLLQNDEFL